MGRTRLWMYVEDVLIVLSILALWPKVLHRPGRLPDVLMWSAFAVMAVVLIRRTNRMRNPVGSPKEEKPR
ncbi:hypothetical protein ACFL01_02770 [Planctomycetota bacterium]